MKILLIVFICIIFAWVIYSLLFRKKKPSISRVCSVCGAESKYGYSERAEDIKNIKPMCRKCLMTQLERDYVTFSGRAVVIQPVPGPPSYVFHSNEEWSRSFKESKMDDDARAYLLRMDPNCRDCGQKANFLWIESSGLTAQNFGNILAKGFSDTLLPRNPKPVSLCGKCCIKHIASEMAAKDLTYLEVSGPRGKQDGFIMPMAY
jgi:hypothetical protein